MAYTPPTGTVPLALGSVLGYAPPTGTVALALGHTDSADRQATLAGETLGPTGRLTATIFTPVVAVVAGETLGPTGRLSGDYDPNLLSAVHRAQGARWQAATPQRHGASTRHQSARLTLLAPAARWQAAALGAGAQRSCWQDAAPLWGRGQDQWQESDAARGGTTPHWQNALHLAARGIDRWQAATAEIAPLCSPFQARLPLLTPATREVWNDGNSSPAGIRDQAGDGVLVLAGEVEVWQPAGYPGNARRSGPPILIPPRPSWGTALRLRCPLPGTALHLGRSPCILIAEREIPIRRTYMSTNSASLVRLPDLAPLPCLSVTVETDFESWCWGLSATLAGPDAWALVQPNPLACEVLATINGQEWKFLLDVPSTQRSFNSDRVSLKGRSRSAWLHDPYTAPRAFSEANAREMEQLAEAALDNTGWTLDWQLANWLVPAGRYVSHNTPIGVLMRLVNTTDDGLYTDPALPVITAQKRWPVASWLLDAATADLLIPESAVISLSQSPVYTPPLNGVYVSGTSHGALALVKIAGTDGALQPAEPLVHELLCDEAGVAARQRGLNALSDSGAGYTMDADVLFTPEIGLVRPGLIVSIAGMKGISRSCRISAQRAGNALHVRQTVGLERREVEA